MCSAHVSKRFFRLDWSVSIMCNNNHPDEWKWRRTYKNIGKLGKNQGKFQYFDHSYWRIYEFSIGGANTFQKEKRHLHTVRCPVSTKTRGTCARGTPLKSAPDSGLRIRLCLCPGQPTSTAAVFSKVTKTILLWPKPIPSTVKGAYVYHRQNNI